jgi:MFS family permease
MVGIVQVIAGTAGFLVNAEFPSRNGALDPENQGELLGVFAVNGWVNSATVIAGLVALFAAGRAPRRFAIAYGVLAAALGIAGFIAGQDDGALTWLANNSADNYLYVSVGALGVLAAVASAPAARAAGRERRLQSP